MDALGHQRVNLGVSPIIIGTMRFSMKSLAVADIQDLIHCGVSAAVDTLHVSTEYDSFPLLQNALETLPRETRSRLKYVVKLACPHFGEAGFDKDLLIGRVDQYLSLLGTDCLSVVQWMWRSESDSEQFRSQKFSECLGEMSDAFDQLVNEGKVGRFACFPYGAEFMRHVRQSGLTQVQIDYCNLLESDLWQSGYSDPSIALRPYAAGRIFEPDQKSVIDNIAHDLGVSGAGSPMELALKLLLCNSSIAGVVVSVSDIEQLESCIRISGAVEPDPAEFARIVQIQSHLKTE